MKNITKIIPPAYEAEPKEENDLDCAEKEACGRAADAIHFAFDWSKAGEGGAFWYSVYNRLVAIGNGEPLK